MRWGLHGLAGLGAVIVLAVAAGDAEAQAVRGSLRTTSRYLEARPITQDTVSRSRVTERPDGGLEFDGHPVVCIGELPCIYYRSLPKQAAALLVQEADATAWGLGVQGLSATVLVRARTRLGGDFTLPRADDHFDAVLAYLELNRDLYRVRLGRQRTGSGLGFTGFDGVELLVDPNDWLRVQTYAGRSLARGLSEPRQTALRGLDDAFFLPDREAILVGGELGATPSPGTALALRYQFEIWSDRGGMLSERASLSARTTDLEPVTLAAQADYDFAFGRIGKAHITAQLPTLDRRMLLEATLRRYVPYFELWTIWGMFSPVGHHEALLRTTWRPNAAASVWLAGGYRWYEETHADILLDPLHSRAWRAELGGVWRLPADLTLSGNYRWEGPVGALLTSADVALRWQAADRLGLGVHGALFQQAEEFRLSQGTVLGAGGSLDLELWDAALLSGGVDLFRHAYTGRPGGADWNQLRAWMGLQIGIGRDPGAGRGVAP